MQPLEILYLAAGAAGVFVVLHLVIFWVARFLYPPVKQVYVQPSRPMMPVVQQAPPPPTVVYTQPPPQPVVTQPPPNMSSPMAPPPAYAEITSHAQVPVLNHEPLPAPIQVGKRPEDDQKGMPA